MVSGGSRFVKDLPEGESVDSETSLNTVFNDVTHDAQIAIQKALGPAYRVGLTRGSMRRPADHDNVLHGEFIIQNAAPPHAIVRAIDFSISTWWGERSDKGDCFAVLVYTETGSHRVLEPVLRYAENESVDDAAYGSIVGALAELARP